MPIEIKKLRDKQRNIAIAYSSKERMAFSEKSAVPLLAESAYDVYWIDGSSSEEGKALPLRYKESKPLCEIHTGVRGGADAAIVYSLSLLLDKGYDYIGLLENDILLQPGWWPRTFQLFEEGKKDGLLVGGVSARCYAGRIHVPRNGYGLMNDLGAGMALYTREAVECILDHYRTAVISEIAFHFEHYTGVPTSYPWQMDPNNPQAHVITRPQTADWLFQTSMLPKGLVALAPTPTLAINMDSDDPLQLQAEATKIHPQFPWEKLCQRLKEVAARKNDPVGAVMSNYDPCMKNWRAYPHQILAALPGAFQGNWKLKWSRMHGPFAMVTVAPGASIRLIMHGMEMGIFLDSGGKPLTLSIRGDFGEAKMKIAEKPGWQWANICFQYSGPFPLEVVFDSPDVIVGHFAFEGPQEWFKSGYGLRYAHLKPYLE